MASQLPGVVVGGLVSLVVAVVLLFVQRYLREHGEIYREVSWTIPLRTGSKNLEHGFEGRFVNQKDVDTALWEIRLEFHKGGERVGNPLTCYLTDSNEAVRFLNLPSRVSIVREMHIQISASNLDELKDMLRPLAEADGAEFVGAIPGGEEIRQELKGTPKWPYVDDL
jgi:hypothetical protein